MYRKFELSNTYTLPNGKTFTGEDLKMNPEYSGVIDDNTVVDVVGGILTSFDNILKLSEIYGVDDLDIDAAVSQINAIKATITKNKIAAQMSADSTLKAAKILALSFTDEQAVEVPDLYPEYELNHEYKQNDRFQYAGTLYKVNQDHTSAAQWVPGTSGTESLYTNLMLDESGYQIWKQPTGAHDAYNTGDLVRYPDKDGQLYKSLIDGNVYSPDTYPQGWEVYTEE